MIIMRKSALDKLDLFKEKSTLALTQAQNSSQSRKKSKLLEIHKSKLGKKKKIKGKLNAFKKNIKHNKKIDSKVTFKTDNQTKIILIEGIEETEFQNEDKQSFISSEKLKSTFKLKTHCSKPDLLSIQNTNKLNPILEKIKTNKRYKANDNESKIENKNLSEIHDSSLISIHKAKKVKKKKMQEMWELSEY